MRRIVASKCIELSKLCFSYPSITFKRTYSYLLDTLFSDTFSYTFCGVKASFKSSFLEKEREEKKLLKNAKLNKADLLIRKKIIPQDI